MKNKRTFVQGKMNKDIDERLLPDGQYPDAENIRVINTSGSDIGAIENTRGNEKLTSLNLTNAVTIGVCEDGANHKLYWAVTSDTKDMILEYDDLNKNLDVVIESSTGGVLNFSKDHLINAMVKINNGDQTRDLLVLTDDLNGIRSLNIERAKTYGLDGFTEEDISLIKNPPRYAPEIQNIQSVNSLSNNLEDKFYRFAYRYKYLDGYYSAISPFTECQFTPKSFKLDYQSMENLGMVNNFNSVNIIFNTGDRQVTDIQLLFKEDNSNNVNIIETFNKEEQVWGNNENQSYLFDNSKVYQVLPEDQLFRLFDNVPNKAKALDIVGNRIMIGNYTEGHDMIDVNGDIVNLNYSLSHISNEITGDQVPVELSTDRRVLNVNMENIPLSKGTKLSFNIILKETTFGSGDYSEVVSFIFNRDYIDVQDLVESDEFSTFVESVMTNSFINGFESDPPENSTVESTNGFTLQLVSANIFSVSTPSIAYELQDNSTTTSFWNYTNNAEVTHSIIAVNSTVKSNRSYEASLIYYDSNGRMTPSLTNSNNTLSISQEFTDVQNKIQIDINHLPPEWADRYSFAIKQNKGGYETIYTNLYYEDGLFRWIKLEGANKDKIKEGDTLIVKSDLGGVVYNPIEVRVLDVQTFDRDFIEGNENIDGDPIIEEAGTYFKIKPVGFDMSFNSNTARTFEGGSHLRYPVRTYTEPEFSTETLNAGSTVKIRITFEARGSISYYADYENEFRVNGDYNTVEEWFNTEVKDLGSFGRDFTWNGTDRLHHGSTYGYGIGDENNKTSGWGFENNKFYVMAHRDGTASRSITTTVSFEILRSEGTVIFETKPDDSDNGIYYQVSQVFDIVNNKHQGNIKNQTVSDPKAIVELDWFNAYVQGNGAETYKYKDTFNGKYLNNDSRPTTTSIEEYREVHRFADITYSEVYNENTNVNGLNEFNLFKANFKDDLFKTEGGIQRLHARDTDLIVFQEDKVSKVLFGKDLLLNADGTSNVSSIQDVLGQQIPFSGEWGISKNPESFASDGKNMYFTDAKRGAVMRLNNHNGLFEISSYGMRQYYKDEFIDSINSVKLGGFDPYLDQYILYPTNNSIIEPSEISCGETINRANFVGDLIINGQLSKTIGQAGIEYSTNGVPVQIVMEWNGNTYTTGFIGDAQYNNDLSELGLGNVTGGSTGTLFFDKNVLSPTKIKITVNSPLCNSNVQIKLVCPESSQLNVTRIILNDSDDTGLNMVSQYRWINGDLIGQYRSTESEFNDLDELQFSDTISGNEGDNYIPYNNSTILIESIDGTAKFQDDNKFGYLVSNIQYNGSNLQTILDNATFITTPTVSTTPSGQTINQATFNFIRNNQEQYLYLIWDYRNELRQITQDTKIHIYFDSSGSMDSTLAPLRTMRDTLLKDRLISIYNNDSNLYDSSVTIIERSTERPFSWMNMEGQTPDGNVVILVFTDESSPYRAGSNSGIAPCPPDDRLTTDVGVFKSRLNGFDEGYYAGVLFQVDGFSQFRDLVQKVSNGTDCYSSNNANLAGRPEINFKFDITDGETPQYYLDQITQALIELGYEL